MKKLTLILIIFVFLLFVSVKSLVPVAANGLVNLRTQDFSYDSAYNMPGPGYEECYIFYSISNPIPANVDQLFLWLPSYPYDDFIYGTALRLSFGDPFHEVSAVFLDFEINTFADIYNGFYPRGYAILPIDGEMDFTILIVMCEYVPDPMYEIGVMESFLNDNVYVFADGDKITVTQTVGIGWIQSILSLFVIIFAIELLPGVTIGIIVGIPVFFGLVMFVLKIVRG